MEIINITKENRKDIEKIMNDTDKFAHSHNSLEMNLSNDPSFNPSILLKTIDTISVADLYNTLKSAWRSIIEILHRDKNNQLVTLFTNLKFVKAFSETITSSNYTQDDIITCNSIVYDYITFKNQNDEIKAELLNMAFRLNADVICVLMGLQIPKDIAICIAVSRRSSYDESINIKRMNFMIITSGLGEAIDGQMIANIYSSLFSSVRTLFNTIMTTPLPEEEWVTESVAKIDSDINIAILAILESMSTQDIYTILKQYIAIYSYCIHNLPPKPRFSLRAIALGDYPKIISMIELLDSQGIHIP